MTDRARPWVAGACMAWLLVMAGLYGYYSITKPVGFRYCLSHLEECRGRTILLPLWRVTDIRADGYDLYKITGPIPVEGDPEGLALGDTLSVVSVFDPDRQLLVEREREVHHLRKAKVLLGILGVLMTAVLVLVGFRWQDGRLVARG